MPDAPQEPDHFSDGKLRAVGDFVVIEMRLSNRTVEKLKPLAAAAELSLVNWIRQRLSEIADAGLVERRSELPKLIAEASDRLDSFTEINAVLSDLMRFTREQAQGVDGGLVSCSHWGT